MPQLSLLDQARAVVRLRHYSIRTEEAYVNVIRRFILYHNKRHPGEMGVDEIRQYLSHLATDGHVATSTQNVALAAPQFNIDIQCAPVYSHAESLYEGGAWNLRQQTYCKARLIC